MISSLLNNDGDKNAPGGFTRKSLKVNIKIPRTDAASRGGRNTNVGLDSVAWRLPNAFSLPAARGWNLPAAALLPIV